MTVQTPAQQRRAERQRIASIPVPPLEEEQSAIQFIAQLIADLRMARHNAQRRADDLEALCNQQRATIEQLEARIAALEATL